MLRLALALPLLTAAAAPWDGIPAPVPAATPPGVAGEPLTFPCAAWSPCAVLQFTAPEGGAGGYRLRVESGLAGGFDVRAERLEGVPRGMEHMVDRGGWNLGGYGIEPGGPWVFERTLPAGTAATWTFTFAPSSGEEGGAMSILLEWLPAGAEARPPQAVGGEPCFLDGETPCWKDTSAR